MTRLDDFCLDGNCTLQWKDHVLSTHFLVWYNGIVVPIVCAIYCFTFVSMYRDMYRINSTFRSQSYAQSSCTFAAIGYLLYGIQLALGTPLRSGIGVSIMQRDLVVLLFILSFAFLSVPALLVHALMTSVAESIVSGNKTAASGVAAKKTLRAVLLVFGTNSIVCILFMTRVAGDSAVAGVQLLLLWTAFIALFIIYSIVSEGLPLYHKLIQISYSKQSLAPETTTTFTEKRAKQVATKLWIWNCLMMATCVSVAIMYTIGGVSNVLHDPVTFMVINNIVVCNALTCYGFALIVVVRRSASNVVPANMFQSRTKRPRAVLAAILQASQASTVVESV